MGSGLCHCIMLFVIMASIFISGCAQIGQPAKPTDFVLYRLDEGTVGTPYNYSFCRPDSSRKGALCAGTTTYPDWGTSPYVFSVEFGGGFLPLGLGLELNGLLRGTPTVAGDYEFGICAEDANGNTKCTKHAIMVFPKEEPKPKIEKEVWVGSLYGYVNPQWVAQCAAKELSTAFFVKYDMTLNLNLSGSPGLVTILRTNPPTMETLEIFTDPSRVSGMLNGVQSGGIVDESKHHAWEESPPVIVGVYGADADWTCKQADSNIKDLELKIIGGVNFPDETAKALWQQYAGTQIIRNDSLAEMVFEGKKEYIFPNRYEIDFYGTQRTATRYKAGQFMYTENFTYPRNALILEIKNITDNQISGTWRDAMKLNEVEGVGYFTLKRVTGAVPDVDITFVSCSLTDVNNDGRKDMRFVATGTATGSAGSKLYMPVNHGWSNVAIDCGTWTPTSGEAADCIMGQGDMETTVWSTSSDLLSNASVDWSAIFKGYTKTEGAILDIGGGVMLSDKESTQCT